MYLGRGETYNGEGSKKFKELIDLKSFGKNYMGISYADSVNSFLTGQSAMLLMGSWVNSQIEADDSPAKGKVVPFKFPAIPRGKGNADEWYGGSGETFVINSKIENQAAIWEVYKYFIETMAREVFLAGSGSSAWKGDMGDTSKMSPFAKQIGELSAGASGFMSFAGGSLKPEAYNKELVSKIAPGK